MLSVIFIENLRGDIEEIEDGKVRRASKGYLMRQSINLQNWIMKLKSFGSILKGSEDHKIDLKSISTTPRDLVQFKTKIDAEVESMSRLPISLPKSASKFPTPSPVAQRSLKNEPLFVSPMLPNHAVIQKTYFGNKLSSK